MSNHPLLYSDSCLNLNETVDYNPRHFTTFRQFANLRSGEEPFDSNFESGNLLFAYASAETPGEFDLILQNDFNTKGYNQWFYFSFQAQGVKQAKINIVNLVKKRSMFMEGVRPVWARSSRIDLGWHSTATDINYYKSMVYRENGEHYYTLSFRLGFEQDELVYVALNPPYTYSRLVSTLDRLLEAPPMYGYHHAGQYKGASSVTPSLIMPCRYSESTQESIAGRYSYWRGSTPARR